MYKMATLVCKVPLSFLPYCETMFHHIHLYTISKVLGVDPYLSADCI